MGSRNNPGRFDCYSKAEPDEPMFVLLGRDPVAPILINLWADIRAGMGEEQEKLEEAMACAEACYGWLTAHGKGEAYERAVKICEQEPVVPFRGLHRVAKPELLNPAAIEAAARAAHEVNRAYCLALGDDSQLVWDEAPEWQRESARKGAALHVRDPDTTPEQSHLSWLKEKEADGWKYGLVKDAETKTHPCMVPYAKLPLEQQAKDYLFRATVHAAWAVWAEAQKDALT